MLTAALAIAHQVAGKSLREGLFLSTYSVSDLPKVMLGSALAAIPLVLLVARLMTRHGPDKLTPALFMVSALLSLLEWALLPALPRAIALTVYLHVSIGGALLISAFWSVVNERFDPHTLKHWIGRITASATLGGLLGGVAMERVARWVNARSALPLLAGMCACAALCSFRLAGSQNVAPSPAARSTEPVRFTRYLYTLALLVTSLAAGSAFADFALKQAAVARFGSAEALVRFFALFYTGASLASFLLQALVARPLFASVGLGGTLAVAPLAGLGLGALATSAPSFLSISALRGADLALGPSLFRSAFEPLFTPLPSATKRATKSLIDVVFDKGGDAVASSLILLVSFTGPTLLARAPMFLATSAFGLGLLLALRAKRGYLSELEASLRAGTVSIETVEKEDPAARLTMSATTLGIDRDKLREQIARARAEHAASTAELENAEESAESAKLTRELRVLLGSNQAAIRTLLQSSELDPRLAIFVVPHLGSEALMQSTLSALRGMGPDVMGLLADVMLSSSQPATVRRRVPHVLRVLRGPRVASALTRALAADALEVRYRAALALQEVTRDEPALRPDAKDVLALVLQELQGTPLSQAATDHVFALLALCTARGALELVRQGLKTDDRRLRGTALEYLETMLPENVRAPIVQALSQRPEPLGPKHEARSEAQLVDELRRSLRGELSPQALAGEPD